MTAVTKITSTSITLNPHGRWQAVVNYSGDFQGCFFCGAFRWLWLAHLVCWWYHRQIITRPT